jgi:hypothetical protein
MIANRQKKKKKKEPDFLDFQQHSDSRNEVLRIILLLLEALLERCQTRKNTTDHEEKGDERPDDAPALRRASITLREDASIGRVDFSQNQIVADIPDAV